MVSSASVTIQGPSRASRQTWVNRSDENSVLVARSYSQRVAISRIGACITSIARPCLPSSMVSARVTAVTFIDRQDVAAVRLGAEIEPQRRVDVAGVALSMLKCPAKVSTLLIDMNSLSRSGNSDSGEPGAISDSICARIVGSSLPKPVSISSAASGWVSR